MANNNFDGTRAYLVGRKVLLEENMEKLQKYKDAFETECIELMEKLESIMKEGLTKYQEEIDRIKVSIDLHQDMLLSLDTESEINSIDNFSLQARKELTNLETVIGLTDSRVKQLFTQKARSPQVIKRTVIEPEVKAVVDEVPPTPIKPKKEEERKKAIDEIADKLFKKAFKYNPYPEEYYVRQNGYINNIFVSERLYEYMKDYKSEMTVKEMAEWCTEMFPKAPERWGNAIKGVQNMIHQYLKKKGLVEMISYGVWRVKE